MTALPVPLVHDADSHVMESPDWFVAYADPGLRARLRPAYDLNRSERQELDRHRELHADPAYRAEEEEQVWLRKNWRATGSLIAEDRSRALDLLGFASQLVFNTFTNKELVRVEHGGDVDYTYGLAQAHNRAMVDFCSGDHRLLAVGYVPLVDFERAAATA
ncbi:MAG TPA: hypothetical protein VF005_05780, partial [Acidimicrobiales bacterium]